MADRRMFHKKVVESDPFYQLPEGAQGIYVHLCMNADDDGFVNNAQGIATRFKAGQAKLAVLVAKRFVLKFGDVYVIKHWRIGNSLKNDRTKPPTYPGIAAKIWVKPNRAYTDHPVPGCRTLLEVKTGIQMESKWNPNGIQMESKWNPNGIQTESQKNRTEENRTEPNRTPEGDFERLYSCYPAERRGSKATGFDAFRIEMTSPEDFDTAMQNLEEWKRSEQWAKDGGQYIPYLSNWLERGIWQTLPTKKDSPWGASGELGEAELEAIRQMFAESTDEQEVSDEYR